MKLIKLLKRHTYRISYGYTMSTLFEFCSHDVYENIKAFTKNGAVRKFKRSLYKQVLKNLVIKDVEEL